MTLFWIVTAALSLAVALLLARALLRGRRDTGPAQAFDIQVYRDQLKDVERDLARGVIEAGDAERVRTEISRRILAADSAMRAQGGEAPARRGPGLWTAVVMSAPLLGVALVAGVVVGLFQALTSVQEMTLTFVPKILAMLAVFWISMSAMTALLVDFFQRQVIPAMIGG